VVSGNTRVLIVDDHQVFADALSWRLSAEPDLEIVGVAASREAALRAIDLRRPDVVVLDVELGDDRDGLALLRLMQERDPAPNVLVVTAHDDPQTASRAMSAGARGFVPKDTPAENIAAVVRGIVAGETLVPPRLLTDVISYLRDASGARNEWQERITRLTPREREILALMVSGMDRVAIATRLYLSINTVRTHNKNILAKLQVHSSLEAVSVALRAGIRPESIAEEHHPGLGAR
jgi:DNA-binding NarL/FixJ family response regulator